MQQIAGRVIELNKKIEGSFVELSDGSITLRGRVAAVSVNEFLVEWEDGARSVENKSDYELVVEAHKKTSLLPPGITNPGSVSFAPMSLPMMMGQPGYMPPKTLGPAMRRPELSPSAMFDSTKTVALPAPPPAMPPASGTGTNSVGGAGATGPGGVKVSPPKMVSAPPKPKSTPPPPVGAQ